MMKLCFERKTPAGRGTLVRQAGRWWICAGLALLGVCLARAQDDQLNKVHVPPPGSVDAGKSEPKGAEAPAASGPDALKIRPGARIRMNVDMVLVPVTVQIKNRDVTFVSKDGVQRGTVNIFGRATTLTGRIAQTFEDTVRIDVPTDLLAAGCFGSAVASVMVENSGPDFPLTLAEATTRQKKLLQGPLKVKR